MLPKNEKGRPPADKCRRELRKELRAQQGPGCVAEGQASYTRDCGGEAKRDRYIGVDNRDVRDRLDMLKQE